MAGHGCQGVSGFKIFYKLPEYPLLKRFVKLEVKAVLSSAHLEESVACSNCFFLSMLLCIPNIILVFSGVEGIENDLIFFIHPTYLLSI